LNFSKENSLHVDITIRKKQKNNVYTDKYSEEYWGIHENDLFPLRTSVFENITVKVPSKSEKYLKNGYGEDCISNPKTKKGKDSYEERW